MGARLDSNRAPWWGAALLLCACTGQSAPPAPIEDPDGGSLPRPDGGRADGGRRDGAVDGGGDELGPVLELLELEEGSVIVGTTFAARCKASKNPEGDSVNPTTVVVALYAGNTAAPFAKQPAMSTSEADVYEADIALAEAPHGAVRVECSAEDIAAAKHKSVLSVSASIDRGPTITFQNPLAGGFVPAGSGEGEDVRVRFKVEPNPLEEDDADAEIDEITVTVSGKEITALEQSASEQYAYSFGLDFADRGFFGVVPDRLDVIVTAKNRRNPAATARLSLDDVGVDGIGPTIVMLKPVPLVGTVLPPVVSGKVDVALDVKDALSRVAPETVQVVIETPSGGKKSYATVERLDGQFEMSFQTNEFPGIPRLALTLIAKDKAGVETRLGKTIDVDTVPPWISLVPHNIRERNTRSIPINCSGSYDPVGDAVNDGQVTARAFRPRAVLWDRPLLTSGLTSVRYAMIDDPTVQLWVQHNTDTPLLIDTDNDGFCDSINANPADESKRPTAVQLTRLSPNGSAPSSREALDENSDNDFGAAPTVTRDYCTPAFSPDQRILCPDTKMVRLAKHSLPTSIGIVYASNPVAVGTGCTGLDYISPRPGWACLAVHAKDNAGNLGLSMPIRVCNAFDTDDPGAELDGNCGATPPADPLADPVIVPVPSELTCTDGCTMPDWFTANPVGENKAMPAIIDYFD